MSAILEAVQSHPIRRFAAGEMVISQGSKTGLLFFLIEAAPFHEGGEIGDAERHEEQPEERPAFHPRLCVPSADDECDADDGGNAE